jgi:hypothetical protein
MRRERRDVCHTLAGALERCEGEVGSSGRGCFGSHDGWRAGDGSGATAAQTPSERASRATWTGGGRRGRRSEAEWCVQATGGALEVSVSGGGDDGLRGGMWWDVGGARSDER